MIAGYTASTQIAGNQPFSIVAPKSSGGTQPNAASPAQGFIYGPYSYPYGAGRVIGPIIALGLFLLLFYAKTSLTFKLTVWKLH